MITPVANIQIDSVPSHITYLGQVAAQGLGNKYVVVGRRGMVRVDVCFADKTREAGLADVVSVTLAYFK